MKPYHAVAMYNQAVQALELLRKPPHHPPLQLFFRNFTQTTIFFKRLFVWNHYRDYRVVVC